jgi:4-oxalomesaconate hydratase
MPPISSGAAAGHRIASETWLRGYHCLPVFRGTWRKRPALERRKDGGTLSEVESIRRREAENAVKSLNLHDIQFFDLGDYPLVVDHQNKMRLVDVLRDVQPKFMLSHSKCAPCNTDQMHTSELALEVRMIAQACGHNPGEEDLGITGMKSREKLDTDENQKAALKTAPLGCGPKMNLGDVSDKRFRK